ncbi:MAG: hypothetical protein HQ517_01575 [SAR324 cluster bacterium]|nr:hypothetical protein [SAR324 cluster bacterium]
MIRRRSPALSYPDEKSMEQVHDTAIDEKHKATSIYNRQGDRRIPKYEW